MIKDCNCISCSTQNHCRVLYRLYFCWFIAWKERWACFECCHLFHLVLHVCLQLKLLFSQDLIKFYIHNKQIPAMVESGWLVIYFYLFFICGHSGVYADKVGIEAAEMLLRNIRHNGCVDEFLQDQVRNTHTHTHSQSVGLVRKVFIQIYHPYSFLSLSYINCCFLTVCDLILMAHERTAFHCVEIPRGQTTTWVIKLSTWMLIASTKHLLGVPGWLMLRKSLFF